MLLLLMHFVLFYVAVGVYVVALGLTDHYRRFGEIRFKANEVGVTTTAALIVIVGWPVVLWYELC